MKILFIGDIVGRPGRRSVALWVPRLREEFALDFVIANAENSAGGLGATPEIIDEIFSAGVQAITLGNHTWRKKSLVKGIDLYSNVVRPANYAKGVPGRGSTIVELDDGRAVGLVNVLGRVYMEPCACPFEAARSEIARLRETTSTVLVDVHAEATAEKVAMGWFLDGTCSAVVGTHTHVQTADERVLPGGTAYITDVGMTGPMDSVIGVERGAIIQKFFPGTPTAFVTSKARPGLNGVVVETDDATGKACSIQRVVRIDG
jgi:metallophosphoesterase (TIGR00282 family)